MGGIDILDTVLDLTGKNKYDINRLTVSLQRKKRKGNALWQEFPKNITKEKMNFLM